MPRSNFERLRDLFELPNPDYLLIQAWTCPARIASGARRCRQRADGGIPGASDIIDRIPGLRLTPDAATIRSTLRELADIVVCHHHQEQTPEIVMKWYRVVIRNFDSVMRKHVVEADQAEAATPAVEAEPEVQECGICIRDLVQPLRTPCGHTYCASCLIAWFKGAFGATCPMDRRELRMMDLVVV
ncbi:PDZ domain-containing RING finger protein 4 [Extremus antarcticus]|uniref:PDZ domain-containing RING finger protein 4 n=1 Tax=Extremus antarcticus TaxID=702011 RepID=A0AAJ0DKS1_9PEZI|nr:PDZ domain-containing RING finger protein 4 [Extremus antarcticus]